MNAIIRSYLIELARKKTNQTITYSELCKNLSLKYDMSIPYDRVALGDILERISRNEFSMGRKLLSSLVVRKNDLEQGDGFYKMCEDLGYGNWRKLKSDITFQINIINETLCFWQNEEHYNKFK